MADFLAFNEGKTFLANSGLPSTCYFLLSTKGVDAGTAFTAADALASAGSGEIPGTATGYTRQSQAEPTAVSGVVSFLQMTWSTGSATNWPSGVKSIVLVTTTTGDNTGKMICAWNLQTGGVSRDLSAANTTENVTPTLNVG